VFGVSRRITSWVPIEGAEAIDLGYGVPRRVSSPQPLVALVCLPGPAVDAGRTLPEARMLQV
jgi:hypothetical protein